MTNDYENKTIKELKALCKNRNLKKYSKMKKIELIEYLKNNNSVKTKREKIDDFFSPNEKGESEWKRRDELPEGIKLTNNGNQRHGIFFGDDINGKYKEENLERWKKYE